MRLGNVEVFCRNPQYLHGAAALVLKPDCVDDDNSELLKHLFSNDGHLSVAAVNPISAERIPVILSDDYFTALPDVTAAFLIPSVNDDDRVFADKHRFTYRSVIDDNDNDGMLIASDEVG